MEQKKKPLWTYKLYPYWKMLVSSGQYNLDDKWLDFYTFNADVGLRPQGHSLKQVNPSNPIGPNNFVWAESIIKVGKLKDPIRQAFSSMWHRCVSVRSPEFHNYGGRGIKVCDRWKSFEQFKADMGPRPQGYSLERKDVNGNYSPENCVWADIVTQARNKRCTIYVYHCGMKLDLMTACQLTGKNYKTIAGGHWGGSHQARFEASGLERADKKVRRLLRAESKASEQAEKTST